MGNAMTRCTAMVLASCVLAVAPALALAAPTSFKVALSGAQQVPAVQSPATGSADLSYDPATRVVTWTITYSGTPSPVTMAHFHAPAKEGANAGVVVWLSKKGEPVGNEIKGEATLTPEQAQQFTAGEMYINVHTKDHPTGEIRGQVVPPKVY